MSSLTRLQRAGLLPVVDQIADEHHVTVDDILGVSRSSNIVSARRHVAHVLRAAPYNRSLNEIAALMGKDQSSIGSMLKKAAPSPHVEVSASTPDVDELLLALAVARGVLRCA
jgi:chromosomal replication initiation ATPase DnaA